MKSLLNIQQDIRKLENRLKDITESIKAISSDIELIRTPEQDISIDFDMIKVLAKNIHYGKHPISKISDKSEQQTYIEMLINIVRFDIDREVTVNRLTFIQWMLNQTEIEYGLEDLYKNSIKMSDKLYCEHLQKISENYKEYFVLDSLIIANIAGTANMEIQRYVADVASIIGVASTELHKLAIIARVVLCKNFVGMDKKDIIVFLNNIEAFECYILKNYLRNIVVCLEADYYRTFCWKKEHLDRVKAGDVIITYILSNKTVAELYVRSCTSNDPNIGDIYSEKEIISPVEGTLYQFVYKNTLYGVIAHEEDNTDSIREWVEYKNS